MNVYVIEGGSEPLTCSDELRVGISELMQVVCNFLAQTSPDEWTVEEGQGCIWVVSIDSKGEPSWVFACQLGLLTKSSSLNCYLCTSDQYVVEQVCQILDRFSWWQGVSVEVYWDKI